jgi:hypothetical protein
MLHRRQSYRTVVVIASTPHGVPRTVQFGIFGIGFAIEINRLINPLALWVEQHEGNSYSEYLPPYSN